MLERQNDGTSGKGMPMQVGHDLEPPDIHLATAELWGTWDSVNPKYHVNLMLSCGPEILKGGDRKYEANLKQCLVKIYTDRCQADFSGAYSYALPLTWKVTESRHSEESKEGEIGVAGTAETKSRWSRFLFSLRASRKAKSGATADETKNIEKLLRLVSYRGGYWAVGDDHHGDPRNTGGWLRDQYFREDPTKPLCNVDLHDGCANATVRIEVWAQPGQISIYELDADGRPKREARSGSRREALGVLIMKAIFRGMAVTKARRAAFSALPLIDAKLPSELVLLDRASCLVPAFAGADRE
jgi:hypothetical protein